MSNPGMNPTSNQSVDVASKVEIQRLKQELSNAEESLAVVPNTNNEMVIREMNEMKEEYEEMKNDPYYEFWKQKTFEANAERNRARGEEHDAKARLSEERNMYREEEREARLNQEDVIRLRRERDEWREYYDEIVAAWTEGGYGYEEEAHHGRDLQAVQ